MAQPVLWSAPKSGAEASGIRRRRIITGGAQRVAIVAIAAIPAFMPTSNFEGHIGVEAGMTVKLIYAE